MLKSESDFDYYDPQRIYTPEDQAFFGATIMRSLVAYQYSADPADARTLVPDMATDTGTANADASVWTFTLRGGLSWQDGSPVTCDDVKYGVSRTFATDVINGGPTYAMAYLNIPKADDGSSLYKGPYSGEGQDLFDQAVQCSGNTITFRLAQSVPDFNYVTTLGFGAVPNPVEHRGVDTGENYLGTDVWSDGPYQITTYTADRHNPGGAPGLLILERNPNWNRASDDYRGAYPDKWEVDFSLEPEEIDQRLIASTGADAFAIDYSSVQTANLPTLFASPSDALAAFRGRAVSAPNSMTSYLFVNTETVPNRQIRAAIAAALDREGMRQALGGDYIGDFADAVVNPTVGIDYAPTGLWDTLLGKAIPPSGDAEYAKSLIEESSEAAPTLTWNYYFQMPAYASPVTNSLQAAGFKLDLQELSPHGSTVFDQGDIGTLTWNSDAWRADWPSATTVIPPLFTDAGGWNLSNVDDSSGVPDWLEQVADAATTIDRNAQAAKWQNLNKDTVDQVWIIPLFFGLSQHIGGTNVGNLFRWTPYASWPYAQLYAKVN
jgi:peptide/nickel transport system substrate-binding protein